MTIEHRGEGVTLHPLVEETLRHIQCQAQEGEGGHPDAGIRSFNKGFLMAFSQDQKWSTYLTQVATKRLDLDATHLADLLARSMQDVLRAEGNKTYASYSPEEWIAHFASFNGASLNAFIQNLEEKSVATHIPERYRGLGALCAMWCNQRHAQVRVADFGCSLNLGLPGILTPDYLIGDVGGNGATFKDHTEGELVKTLLRRDNVSFDRALGIDRQALSNTAGERWVESCAYFGQYEKHRQKLEENIAKITPYIDGVRTVVADVTASGTSRKTFVELLTGPEKTPLDIIHASMMMYQLPPSDQQKVLENAAAAIHEGGIFVELTFENPKNWFLKNNAITTVRFKEGKQLSEPYIWLRWDNSRCNEVWQGNDFETVNSKLGINSK